MVRQATYDCIWHIQIRIQRSMSFPEKYGNACLSCHPEKLRTEEGNRGVSYLLEQFLKSVQTLLSVSHFLSLALSLSLSYHIYNTTTETLPSHRLLYTSTWPDNLDQLYFLKCVLLRQRFSQCRMVLHY